MAGVGSSFKVLWFQRPGNLQTGGDVHLSTAARMQVMTHKS